MKVLVIQNCKTEGVGLYENYLRERRIAFDVFHAYTNRRFPPLKQYNVIIVGGTPISAYTIDQYPFLKKEWRYLQRAIIENKPCFGIC